eukprot:565985-Rhodomonas_salina.1
MPVSPLAGAEACFALLLQTRGTDQQLLLRRYSCGIFDCSRLVVHLALCHALGRAPLAQGVDQTKAPFLNFQVRLPGTLYFK